MKPLEIQSLFQSLLNYIHETHQIDIRDLKLVLDDYGSYPKKRDFAKTSGKIIYLSPKILNADESRVRGLLYHEIGHVLLMREGDFEHSERTADMIAELCFGSPLYYDKDGVQNISSGTRPRPPHLPK